MGALAASTLITMVPFDVLIVTVRVWPAARAGGWLVGQPARLAEPGPPAAWVASAPPIGRPPAVAQPARLTAAARAIARRTQRVRAREDSRIRRVDGIKRQPRVRRDSRGLPTGAPRPE